MVTEQRRTFSSGPGIPLTLAPSPYNATTETRTLAQAPVPQADLERKRQMETAWKAYRGEFKPPLKVREGQPDDNVLDNRCAPIVNKGVSFLFGQDLDIATSQKALIEEIWGDDDDKMTLLSQLGTNGGVCGQPFIKLIPSVGEMAVPRLVVMDPQIVRMVTLPDDCTSVLAYVVEYPIGDGAQKRQVVARIDPNADLGQTGPEDMEDTWTITNFVQTTASGRFMQVGESEDWPYPFAPILTCQNLPNPNEAWGVPDLTPDLIGMNNVLNFIQSNTSRIIKFHGHPKTWGKGFKQSQMTMSVDDVIVLESMDGTLQNLEMTSDLSHMLNFAEVIRQDMDEQSRVPAVALGRMAQLPRGNLSGVALQLLFQPLIEKTIQKQRLYGKLIREVTRAALVLAGKLSVHDYEDFKVELHWQDVLPADDLASAQVAIIYKQLGVSDNTILSRLGFDPDVEAQKSSKEDQAKMEQQQQMGMVPGMPMQGGQAAQGQQQPGQATPPLAGRQP